MSKENKSPRVNGEKIPPGLYLVTLNLDGESASITDESGKEVWHGGWPRAARWVQRKESQEAPEKGPLCWWVSVDAELPEKQVQCDKCKYWHDESTKCSCIFFSAFF